MKVLILLQQKIHLGFSMTSFFSYVNTKTSSRKLKGHQWPVLLIYYDHHMTIIMNVLAIVSVVNY